MTTPLGGSTRHPALLSSAETLVRHPVGPCRALCPAEPPLGAPPPSATDGRGAVHAQPLERDRGGGRRTCGRRPPKRSAALFAVQISFPICQSFVSMLNLTAVAPR